MSRKDLDSDNNCWETPQELFDELDRDFHFEIDLCATKENSKCDCYYVDYLNNVFTNKVYDKDEYIAGPPIQTSFMNPPYSNPKPFIEKAWEDSKHCKIVCLVPCAPSTKWWATFWNYAEYREVVIDEYGDVDYINRPRGPKPGCEVRFFPKRIKFVPPAGYDMTKKYSGPAFGCALVIMDRRNIE